MKRSILVSSVATCICLGLAAALLAAEMPVAATANFPVTGESDAPATQSAAKCLNDLRAFDSRMETDGYRSGGSSAIGTGKSARDVRKLVASARLLARHGQQQWCEDVLAATRDLYELDTADRRGGSDGQD